MALNQSSFFLLGDQSIANSRLSRPGDKRKTTTTGEEEEKKEDRMGGGGRIAFDCTMTTIAAVSSTGRHAPALHLRLIPHPSFRSLCAYHHPCPPLSPTATKTAIATKTSDHDGEIGRIDERMLHPEATYKERYGDTYFDGSVKYLYPRHPRSGLWRFSVLVFMAFGILDVFVVGHCYDHGVRKY